jgi:hypothetical protein
MTLPCPQTELQNETEGLWERSSEERKEEISAGDDDDFFMSSPSKMFKQYGYK